MVRKIIPVIAACIIVVCAVVITASTYHSSQGSVGSISISLRNGSVIRGNVYLELTQKQQEAGFMNDTSVGDCYGKGSCIGMLFVFSGDSNRCFWMRNTIMPLKQSWISGNGTVVYVYSAKPESNLTVCDNATSVLETPANSPISEGDIVSFQMT